MKLKFSVIFTLRRGNQANNRAPWEGRVSIELLTSQGNTINPVTDHNWISIAESPHSDIILIQFLKSQGHISLRVPQRPFFLTAVGLQQTEECWVTDGMLTAL